MLKVSCIQLKSDNSILNNLKKTEKLILKAVYQKTQLVITPEVSSLFSLNKDELIKKTTTMLDDIYVKRMRYLAAKHNIWILLGSVIVKNSKKRLVNRSILIDRLGRIRVFYDKIHLYDAVLSKKEKYFESKTFVAGKKIKSFNTPWGKIGLSICYDLRFPNLYRKLSQAGSIFLSIPSAFSETTGKKHWHALLKARAIENFCYVFAPAQGGKHYNGRKTYGHSMIVSPDGKILKKLKRTEGVISVNIDPELPKELRKRIPSLKQD